MYNSWKLFPISRVAFLAKTAYSSTASASRSVVRLKKCYDTQFRRGIVLICDKSILEVLGAPQTSDEVSVTDNEGQEFARGVFNTTSNYKVRILAWSFEKVASLPIESLITERIRTAVALRSHVVSCAGSTNVYRLINSEGDYLSGLHVDVFNGTVVAQSSAAWIEKYRDCISSGLSACLNESAGDNDDKDDSLSHQVIWKSMNGRLLQDGVDISSVKASPQPGDKEVVSSVVCENGVVYNTSPGTGQKTGFYCDQRDNRKMIRELARGVKLLFGILRR